MGLSARRTGSALLFAASFIWGTSFVAQRIGAGYVGTFTFLAVRFAIATLSLLPVVYFVSGRKNAPKTAEGLRGLLAGSFCCGMMLFTFAALQQTGLPHTTVGKAGFITALYIVVVAAIGAFSGHRVRPVIWVCIAIALAGMYALCIKGEFALSMGDAFMAGGALFVALHILCVGHFSQRVDALWLSCLQFLTCSLISLPLALLLERPTLPGLVGAMWPLLYTGVLCGAVAYTFQVVGQARVNPMITSLILSLESVFAALAGWAVLGEVLSHKELFGCALIFTSVIVAQVANSFGKDADRGA